MYKYIILLICLLYPIPVYASPLGDIASQFFSSDGEGSFLIKLMLLAVVGWILENLASMFNNNRLAGYIKLGTIMIAIIMMTTQAISVLKNVTALIYID